MATSIIKSKKNQKIKFKKAPGAPRRFKSAYMFFSESMHKVMRQHVVQNKKIRAAEVAKMVSQSWKNLTDEERAPWIEMGRKDRERYEVEKASYTGPWKVPATTNATVAEGAPKKPMSAFLAFSNQRRKALATENPHLTGTQISTLLSKMWKECPAEVKQTYRDTEARERAVYKRDRAAWEAQVQANLLAAASSSNSSLSQSESEFTQEDEELPQAPQCISSLYTALENELRSFKPSQHVVMPATTNTSPAVAHTMAMEKMPPATTSSTTLFSFSNDNMVMQPQQAQRRRQQQQQQSCTNKLRTVSQDRYPEFEAWQSPKPATMQQQQQNHEVNYSLDDLLACEELFEDFVAPRSITANNNENNTTDAFSARLAALPSFNSCSSFFA